MAFRSFVYVLLAAFSVAAFAAFTPIEDIPKPQVLAPGYGELAFKAPAAGTYSLPALGAAGDGTVLDSTGKVERLHSLFGDKIVLLNFMYSTCSDVNGCPLATEVFYRIRARLQHDPELEKHLRLISLSFDPQHDSPQVMRLYGSGFQGTGVEWDFLTTRSEQDLKPILDAYGQNLVRDPGDGGGISHILRVFLVDRSMRIRNIYSVSFLHPDILINDVKTLLAGNQEKPAGTAVQTADSRIGPGDYKEGYETEKYVTRSLSLAARTGHPADLMKGIEQPPLGLPPVPIPADNPITGQKVQLGRRLFYDRRLSLNSTFSCAMCHIPEQGFTSNEMEKAVGIEGRPVRRNAPSLYNVAYRKHLFHDGREDRLENQVWSPMLASNEMGNPSIGGVVDILRHLPEYKGLFEAAFDGRGPDVQTIGQALASYERTLVSGDSPFDRWYYGKDASALSTSAQRGFAVFAGKGGCSSCHRIGTDHALFTDDDLHSTGIGWYASMRKDPPQERVQLAPGVAVDVDTHLINSVGIVPQNDLGLYEVTQNPRDRWRYTTPSLRNVALSAPYMHDGSLATLKDVIDYYDRGGHPEGVQDPRVHPLGLTTEEKDDLLAFLKSLTGDNVETLVADAFAAPVGDHRKTDFQLSDLYTDPTPPP